jgi:hypothetical protein
MPTTQHAATSLVAEALLAMSKQRVRVASTAAQEVTAEKAAGRDVRPSAVKVTALLADAAELEAISRQLATGELVLTTPLPRTGAELSAASIAANAAAAAPAVSPAAELDAAVTGLQQDTNLPDLGIELPDEEDSSTDVVDVDLSGGVFT